MPSESRQIEMSVNRLAASIAIRLFFPFLRVTTGPRPKRILTTIKADLATTIAPSRPPPV
jgi:hypothetical protein